MNPEICDRCKFKYSLYQCQACGESFCSECDNYIHSMTSKKSHKRNMIYSSATQETISKLNLNIETEKNFYNNQEEIQEQDEYEEKKNYLDENQLKFKNYDNITTSDLDNNLLTNIYSEEEKNINSEYKIAEGKQIPEVNSIKNNNKYNSLKYRNNLEVNNIFGSEKEGLLLKIEELTKELEETKTNLGEHIDFLNNRLREVENKYKDQIVEIATGHLTKVKEISLENKTNIKELQNKLQKESEEKAQIEQNNRELIEELKKKDQEIERLKKEKMELYSENESTLKYKSKIEEELLQEKNKLAFELEEIKKEKSKLIKINKIDNETSKNKDEEIKKLKKSFNIEKQKLTEQITSLKEQISSNEDNINSYKNIVERYKSEKENLENEIKKAKTKKPKNPKKK